MRVIHFMTFLMLAASAAAAAVAKVDINDSRQLESNNNSAEPSGQLSSISRRSLGRHFQTMPDIRALSTLLPCRQPNRHRHPTRRQYHHRHEHHHNRYYNHQHHYHSPVNSVPSTTLPTPTNTTVFEPPTSPATPRYNDPDNELIYDIDVRYGKN